MAKPNRTLAIYESLKKWPFGNSIFSKIICRTAPYFGTVKPYVDNLQEHECTVLIKKGRRVHNHIKTVHVIAIANGLEMAMGVMAEASIPKHLRWIPKGMTLNYTAKAGTDIRCVAKVSAEDWKPGDMPVEVKAYDTNGTIVVEGHINLWISEKPKK
ncbi:hotdog fold domain-containing protein [Psychrosphaera aestuarii]|uniref:hotdog fold domain-containing protein n=1 Tax=Psychrosphaera aestuarii TaxID=1266052 RepID=UPI001B31E003|nr:hotdog fold domain-containing protein [Psychrosphaera aestuarii]